MQKLEHGRHHEGTHGRGQGGRVPIQHEEQRESPQAWLRGPTGRKPAGGVGAGGRAGAAPKSRARRSLLASRPTCGVAGRACGRRGWSPIRSTSWRWR